MDAPRIASVERKTNETDIKISLNIDGKPDQKIKIDSGIGFLDHVKIESMSPFVLFANQLMF